MYNLILWHLNSLMEVYLKSTQIMTAQVEDFPKMSAFNAHSSHLPPHVIF